MVLGPRLAWAGQRSKVMADQALEEKVAHLMRSMDDLSDEVARQAKALEVAERRIEMLMGRLAESEAQAGGGIPLADQRPPHW